MHDDHGGHDSHRHDAGQNIHIIDEKSIEDKLLSSLAVMVMIALFFLGCYWSAAPLPAVLAELDANPNGR